MKKAKGKSCAYSRRQAKAARRRGFESKGYKKLRLRQRKRDGRLSASNFLFGTITMEHYFFATILPVSLLARANAFPLTMQIGAGCLFVVLVLWLPLDAYKAGEDIPDAWRGIHTDRLHHYLGALGIIPIICHLFSGRHQYH
jgi:hypothetical protein